MERRLAAILAADVVGFSRQMGADEAGTLARIAALRADVLDPLLAEHRGRLFKTMGDGFLAEFASAVQAVACAVAVQARLANQPVGVRLRIGIHAGDVVVQGEDLMGDGVNIAARLEPLAEAGGIVISARVREDLAGKLTVTAEDMGEPALKNITTPIRAFRIRPAAAPASGPALPDKPSIAVLAFTNMSGDAEQEYFADGIAEDIITALSHIRWLFVIARNSSFTYKGRAVDLKQVGRELGVRYILEGSVRRAGNRLRVTGQLIEADTGTHVWAERYDRTMEDIFDIQDELTRAVVTAIDDVLGLHERERAGRLAPERLSTWETYHRGMWHFFRNTFDDYQEAGRLLLEAARLDPKSALLRTGLALRDLAGGWMFEPARRMEWLKTGREHAHVAATINPRDSMARALYGQALLNWGEHEAALRETTAAVELNPNNSWAHGLHAGVLGYGGRPAEALPHFEQALRLNPLDSLRWLWVHARSTTLYFAGEYEASLASGKEMIHLLPNAMASYRHCMAALTELGRREEADYYADILFERFAAHVTWFLTTRWQEWREVDHNRYIATMAKGGLLMRDGVLTRVSPT
jgi:adenylate cyclase